MFSITNLSQYGLDSFFIIPSLPHCLPALEMSVMPELITAGYGNFEVAVVEFLYQTGWLNFSNIILRSP